jgi:hypothetical protein
VHPPGWGQTPAGFVAPPVSPFLAATPTATMYDSTDLREIPASAFAAAGYVAGSWPTWTGCARCGGSLAGRFPRAHRVSIAIHLGEHAMCGDFESGDMSAGQAGPWAAADIRAGYRTPCEYSDLSEMPAVKASLRAWLGSGWRTRVLLWLAWYTGRPGLVAGYDAVQYWDRCLNRNLDCSTVSLAFLRIARPPYVAPRQAPWCVHHRMSRRACAALRARVASDLRAASSTRRALAAVDRGLRRPYGQGSPRCVHPYRRARCVALGRARRVLVGRERYFTGRVRREQARL